MHGCWDCQDVECAKYGTDEANEDGCWEGTEEEHPHTPDSLVAIAGAISKMYDDLAELQAWRARVDRIFAAVNQASKED